MVHTIPYCTSSRPFTYPNQGKHQSNDLPNSDPRRRRRHRRVDDRTDVDHWLSFTRITIHDATASLIPSQKHVVCVYVLPRLLHVCSSSALPRPRIWLPRLAEKKSVIPSFRFTPPFIQCSLGKTRCFHFIIRVLYYNSALFLA